MPVSAGAWRYSESVMEKASSVFSAGLADLSFIYRGASFLSIAEAFYLRWQSQEDAFYKTRRPRAPSVRGAAFLRAAQSAKTAPCTRCVDARSHRFWLAALMPDIRKKPGKPSDLLNFFAHTSSKAARPWKRQFLMQSRETFRRYPLCLSRKSEEAVCKNCLLGAMLSCGSAPCAGECFSAWPFVHARPWASAALGVPAARLAEAVLKAERAHTIAAFPHGIFFARKGRLHKGIRLCAACLYLRHLQV